MSRRRPERPRKPDIEFTASVKADELRFDEVPDTDVRFFGGPEHESASGSDRENLPEQVEPGVTYRDVRVDYRLATRLVATELGERSLRPRAERPAKSRNDGRT
jgi:hypothetical protein